MRRFFEAVAQALSRRDGYRHSFYFLNKSQHQLNKDLILIAQEIILSKTNNVVIPIENSDNIVKCKLPFWIWSAENFFACKQSVVCIETLHRSTILRLRKTATKNNAIYTSLKENDQ